MIKEAKHRKRLQVERAILQKLEPSPFIAKLDVAFQTESELYFLMDYCAGGDLCYQVSCVHIYMGGGGVVYNISIVSLSFCCVESLID
jgi:hypothetical protein